MRSEIKLPDGVKMSSSKKKKESIQGLTRAKLSAEDYSAHLNELVAGNDRSSALVACAIVDAALILALRAEFRHLTDDEFKKMVYDPKGIISSFAERIDLAYSLGVFGNKAKGMLDCIRRIRNVFAHSLKPLGFDHPLIMNECAKLPDTRLDKPGLIHNLSEQRERYISYCIRLAIILEDEAKTQRGLPFLTRNV